MRQLAVRGAGVTVFAGGATLVIQVGATMVLARLLLPADFGLVAMVTTFSLLLVNLGFNGLTEIRPGESLFCRPGNHQAALLASVDIPAAPVGLMGLFVGGRN